MQRVRRSGPHLLQIKAFEDVQHFQHRRTLTIRQQLVDIISAVIDGNGIHPFAMMQSKILVAQIATDTAEISVHRSRQIAFVECIATALRQCLIAARQIRIFEDLPLSRRCIINQVSVLGVLELLDFLGGSKIVHIRRP